MNHVKKIIALLGLAAITASPVYANANSNPTAGSNISGDVAAPAVDGTEQQMGIGGITKETGALVVGAGIVAAGMALVSDNGTDTTTTTTSTN